MLTALIFISIDQLQAQGVFYFNEFGTYLKSEETATFKMVVDSLDDTILHLHYLVKNGRKWSKPEFLQAAEKISDNVYRISPNPDMTDSFVREFHPNANKMYEVRQTDAEGMLDFTCQALNVFPVIMHGICTWFDIDGMPMIEEGYWNGRRLSERALFNPVDSAVVITTEPQFPGGQTGFRRYIADKVKLPIPMFGAAGGEKVYVKFRINEDGGISDARIVAGEGDPMAEVLLQTVKNLDTKWESAESDGRKIPVWYYASIKFGGSFRISR